MTDYRQKSLTASGKQKERLQEGDCVCQSALFSHMSEVRTLFLFRFFSEWHHVPVCFPFFLLFFSLSFTVCRLSINMENLHWLLWSLF